jgi:hypothetical protein
VIVLAKAPPPFALIGDGGILVGLVKTQDNRHHQNAFSTGSQNTIQLAQRFSVVRHVLQYVRAEEKIKLTIPVSLHVSDINFVVDTVRESICCPIGNLPFGSGDLSADEIGKGRGRPKVHNPGDRV